MKIGIIGAGQIGGTLTRRLAALGNDVFVANSRGPQTLAELTRETGAKAVSRKRQLVRARWSSSPFPKDTCPICPKTCLREFPMRWLWWTPGITIRNNAMAG